MKNIEFAEIKAGDKVSLPGNMMSDVRPYYIAAGEFASKQEPRWQFQIESELVNPARKLRDYYLKRVR